MKQKHIDASREARLWLRDIIIPAFVGVMMIPEAREACKAKAEITKQKVKNFFKK